MKHIARLFLVLFASAAMLVPAHADVFRISGIAVDETAPNQTEARANARTNARLAAANLLIDRLTLPEDRASATSPIDVSEIARFTNSIDTDGEEKYTTTRYISVLAVNFDADTVRDYLEARNVPYVDGQAGLALLVPVAGQNVAPEAWSQAWAGRSNNNVLTPYVASTAVFDRPVTWADVSAEASSAGASRAIVAAAYMSNGALYSRLSELTPEGEERAIAVAGPYASYEEAQAGSVETAQREWKRASVVRTTGAAVMDVVARFSDIREWVTIRKAVEASRIVRELDVQSISVSGADLSFVFAGRPDQLAADLRSRGLQLSGTDDGYVITTAR